jgi:tetratricopeptide (TPR) repeat protein
LNYCDAAPASEDERMTLPLINHRAVVFTVLVATIAIALTTFSAVHAQDQRLPKRTGHINDFAEVLDVATRERLEAVLEKLKDKTHVDFAVATIKSSGSEDLYDYSLAVANDWKIGAPAGMDRSLLVVIAADNGKFFSQLTRGARIYLPEGLVGEMGQQMREQIASGGYSVGVLAGIRTFVDRLGEVHSFDFAALDPQRGDTVAQLQRPRTVQSPAADASENPQPTPTAATAPEATPDATRSSSVTVTPEATVTAKPVEKSSPESTPAQTATPDAQPSETPATPEPSSTSSPAVSPAPTEIVPVAAASATPTENLPPQPAASASPQAGQAPIENSSQPVKTPAPDIKPSASPQTEPALSANSSRPVKTPVPDIKAGTSPANPDDEKEQVELTLTLPADKRIDALKAFIATHPNSVALPRANELLVVAHAMFGDQRMQAGDVETGLQQFRLALSDAPAEMPDRLFTDVIARIPLSLFMRNQRDAAFEIARQAEAMAKSNPKRLLALTEFYLSIENAAEAARLAEAAVHLAPDSAAAHQALGAARHIDLRLDDALSEYAKALSLDPKSAAARNGLADLKRASGKTEEALSLYREQLQADTKNNPARAGLVLSLLELGKKEEAESELKNALADKDQSRNLPLLVGAAYWYLAHNDPDRGFDLAKQAVNIEPRYSWGQIALARAMVANKQPLPAERALRFAQHYGRFPTLDYELATVLASLGLYDEAEAELTRSFSLKDGEIQSKLAGRIAAHANTFTELLAPERRAAIFQVTPADSDANARMMKALLAFNSALSQASPSEDNLITLAEGFIKGDDAMRTYRQVYVAGKFVKKGVAFATVVELMDQAMTGVDAALNVPAATVAVQAEELADTRAQALARGGTPDIPDAPRTALSGLLRAHIEDLAGLALFNLDKPADAVVRLRRAVVAATQGTPLWRSSMWHLGSALEANGKYDQALLYYIKSYVAGPPDPARRSIIEAVYKKVNGTLDGLEDKIGPGFNAASASPSPTPSPR